MRDGNLSPAEKATAVRELDHDDTLYLGDHAGHGRAAFQAGVYRQASSWNPRAANQDSHPFIRLTSRQG